MMNNRAIGYPLPRLRGRVTEGDNSPAPTRGEAPLPNPPPQAGEEEIRLAYLQKPKRLFRSEAQADAGNLA